MLAWQRLAAACLLLAISPCAFSCRQIIGIEPEVDGSDAGAPGRGESADASQLCQRYCETVMSNCTGEYAAYESTQACLEMCALLPAGDEAKPNYTNTVNCRLARAKEAEFAQDSNCASAGPGGNGVCGSNCEAYCSLSQSICPVQVSDFSPERCVQTCPALKDGLATQTTTDQKGDTVACRFVQLSRAISAADSATRDADCDGASLRSPVCLDDFSQVPSCEALCRFVLVTCQEQEAVYEDLDQCMATCQVLDSGHHGDLTENTVGCRLYRARNAAIDPSAQCPQAGPGGDGHCGASASNQATGNCDSLCRIVHHGCVEQFNAAFEGDEVSCAASCSELEGAGRNSGYSVMSAELGGNNVACRMLHAVRALTDDGASCEAAFGGAPCVAP